MLGLHLLVLFLPQGYRAAPAEESSESSDQPQILSQPDEIVAEVGTEVSLPCIAEDLHGRLLIWRKNGKILSIGNQTVDKFGTKYHIKGKLNGNILVISNVDKLDEATFTCCISSESTNMFDHQLRIKTSNDESKTVVIEKENMSKGKVYFARVPSFYTLQNRASSQETEKNDNLRKHEPKSATEFIQLLELYGKNVLKKKEAEEFKEFMLEKLPIPNKKLLRSTHQYTKDIRQTLSSAQLGKILEKDVSLNKVGIPLERVNSKTHSNSFKNQNQVAKDLEVQKKQISSVKNEEKSRGLESKNEKDFSRKQTELHIDSVVDDVSYFTKHNEEEEGSGILAKENEDFETKTSKMSDKFYGQGNFGLKENQQRIPLERTQFDQSKSLKKNSKSNSYRSLRYLPESPVNNNAQDNKKDFEHSQRKGNSLRGQHLPQENLKNLKILLEASNKQNVDDGDIIDDEYSNQHHFEDAHTSTKDIDETEKQSKEILEQGESKEKGSQDDVRRNNEDKTTHLEVISDFRETPRHTREDYAINESIGQERERKFSDEDSNKEKVENASSNVGEKEGRQNTNIDDDSKKSENQHYASNVVFSEKAVDRDLDLNETDEEGKIQEKSFPAQMSAFRYLQEKNLKLSEIDSKHETSEQSATLRGQHSVNVILGNLSHTDENTLFIKNKVRGDMGNSNEPSLYDIEMEEKRNEKTDINVVDGNKYTGEKIDLSNEEYESIQNEKMYPKEIKDIERHFFKNNFELEEKMKAPQRIPYQQKRRQESMNENVVVQEQDQKKKAKNHNPILVLQGTIGDAIYNNFRNREENTWQEETSLSPLASARARKHEFLSSSKHPLRTPTSDNDNRRKYSNEPHPFRSICWGMHC